MRASFFEFHVATSGMFLAKGNLGVISHNIANAATSGYSRQVAAQKASRPLSFYDGKGMVGTGAEITGVTQIRNAYLDKKYWGDKSVLGEYTSKRTQLNFIESTFAELSDAGLTAGFNSFFSTLQDLTTGTDEMAYRTNILTSAQTMATLINNTGQALLKQQSDVNDEVATMVQVINSLGEQIASLNKQITKFEMDGSHANDLRDERARLVDELSRYVNLEVSEIDMSTENKPYDMRYVVMINGYDFVNQSSVNRLEVVARTTQKNEMDMPGLYDIRFASSKTSFDIYHPSLTGELKGLIDIRDGNNANNYNGQSTTSYKGIPHYMNKLNDLVRTFSKAMNEGTDKNGVKIPDVIGHRSGYDMNGNKGGYLFVSGDMAPDAFGGNYSQITCLNFAVNSKIVEEPSLLACSDKDPNVEGVSNNNVILNFLKVSTYKSLFKEGKLSDFIVGMTGELAIDVKQANNFENNYTDVVASIDNQRISVSGVDLNEEIANMLKYQQLYMAAAKLINIIDSIYDNTINRLGA